MAIVFYISVILVLTCNYAVAFLPILDNYGGVVKDVIFNFIRFFVYPVVGHVSCYKFLLNNRQIFLICSGMFFYEHVALKLLQLKLTVYDTLTIIEFFEGAQGLDVLAVSFLIFMPIVILLSYFGILVARKMAGASKNNANGDRGLN